MTHRYFIHLAYNGTNYHGWQVQDNAPTVQEKVNLALSTLLSDDINVTGCGRTDTGVHARKFYAHFDFPKDFNDEEKTDLVFKLNRFLPDDISILNIRKVKAEANSRFDALSRTYKYYVSTYKDAFMHEYSYFLYGDIDVQLMNEAAKEMMGFTDFTSFSKLHTQTKTNNCKIAHAKWKSEGNILVFTIIADRFLRNMVRAIVGTLLDIGRHRITKEEFIQIIESKNRSDAGYSVPAKALFLEDIQYPDDIWLDR